MECGDVLCVALVGVKLLGSHETIERLFLAGFYYILLYFLANTEGETVVTLASTICHIPVT